MTQTVIKWLKQLLELLKSIEENISSPDKECNPLMIQKFENLIQAGYRDGVVNDLSVSLFASFRDKKMMINRFYFHQEGGLDVLMKVYGILVSKEWGDLGIDKGFHIYLEEKCSLAVCNYVATFAHKLQVFQLGGLEMCATALLRRRLQGGDSIRDTNIYYALKHALYALSK